MNPLKKKKVSVGSTTPALPKKKSVPKKLVPARRQPSVEMEDMPDDSERFWSEVPCNPRNILEAANGSDDEVSSVATTDSEDEPEIVEKVEENDDAELSNVSVFI